MRGLNTIVMGKSMFEEGCSLFFFLHDQILDFLLHAVDPLHLLLVVLLHFLFLPQLIGFHMFELFVEFNMPWVEDHCLESESSCGY